MKIKWDGWSSKDGGPKIWSRRLTVGLLDLEVRSHARWMMEHPRTLKVLRGDGRVLAPEWWRFLIGLSWVHVRRKPFIFVWQYIGKIDMRLRWN